MIRRIGWILACSSALAACAGYRAAIETDRPKEAIRFSGVFPTLSAIRSHVRQSGARYWPGYDSAPFGILLVDREGELLLCDERIPAGFSALPAEPSTGCNLAAGPPTWRRPELLAAMPAFGPPSVVVMGTPETTGKSLPQWTHTVFHEHFHQWQTALPDYYRRVEALGLSDGDQTGMWMLDYRFPYTEPRVAAAFAGASRALAEAIEAPDPRTFKARLEVYLQARRTLEATVSQKDWRYFEFQLWQEGVARWTELDVAKRFPDRAVRSSGAAVWLETLTDLRNPDLARAGRTAVYAFGAGEAALLERIGRAWRADYRLHLSMGPIMAKYTSN